MTFLIRLFLVLSLAIPTTAFAYGGDGGGDANTGLSKTTTNKIVRTLTRGVRACFRLDKVYRYDCYRQTYQLAAKQLNGMPAYAGAQAVLIDVEKTLERTIARNEDTAQPQVRRGVQRFRAIKPAALPGAKRDFITALENAETKLLRSADKTGTHYVRIAEAINTNKVLLRSAMLMLPGPVQAALTVFAQRHQHST